MRRIDTHFSYNIMFNITYQGFNIMYLGHKICIRDLILYNLFGMIYFVLPLTGKIAASLALVTIQQLFPNKLIKFKLFNFDKTDFVF